MTLGAFTITGFAGLIAIKFGRKMCLWAACLLCIIANITMMTTTHIGALYVGRLLIGFANGSFVIFSQLYIQEISPAKYRALFFNAFQFCVSLVRTPKAASKPSFVVIEFGMLTIPASSLRAC